MNEISLKFLALSRNSFKRVLQAERHPLVRDSGAPVAEMIRASPLFCHTHCVEAGVVNSIPLAAEWSCPGCIMSLSYAVKSPVAILYVVVICNFDEDL